MSSQNRIRWPAQRALQSAHGFCAPLKEVNIAHKLLEIEILLADDRLVSVLKKLSMPPISAVKPDRIAG